MFYLGFIRILLFSFAALSLLSCLWGQACSRSVLSNKSLLNGLLSFIIATSWTVVLWPKVFSPLRHIPGPDGGTFFHGHLRYILLEWPGIPMREWINSVPNDGLIRFMTVFNHERIILTSPEALSEVLVTKESDWEKPKALRDSLGRLIGDGLLVASGNAHKVQRKALSPAFSYRQIRDTHPVFWGEANNLVRILQDKYFDEPSREQEIPWSLWLNKVTLDMIGLSTMSRSFGALEENDSRLAQAYRQLFVVDKNAYVEATLETLENLFPIAILAGLPLKRNRTTKAGAKAIRAMVEMLIDEKTTQNKPTDSAISRDTLDVLLESTVFEQEEMIDQLMNLLAAGHETTANAMCWALYQLCVYPEWQEKLRRQVRAKISHREAPFERDPTGLLDELPLVDAFCSETLRLFPPVPLTRRTSCRDTTILGYSIPKNSNVLIVPAAVNVSKSLWGPDALEFNPMRWLATNGSRDRATRSNFADLTFLHGPRSCIGKAFARAEMVVLLAMIVGAFELSLPEPSFQPQIAPGFLWKMDGQLPLRTTLVAGW